MKKQGTYSPSYSYTIETLARTICDYEKTIELFEKSGGHIVVQHTNKSGSTNLVKNPIYLSIEKLRSDIVTFSRELGLTPSSRGIDSKSKEATNDFLKFISK